MKKEHNRHMPMLDTKVCSAARLKGGVSLVKVSGSVIGRPNMPMLKANILKLRKSNRHDVPPQRLHYSALTEQYAV